MIKQMVTCVDVHGNRYKTPVDSLSWRPSAYAIIIKDGKLLVSPQFNGYDLPGGGIDLGETPEQAVIREVKEETGIVATNPVIVAATSSFYKPYKPEPGQPTAVESIMLYYACQHKGGKLSMDGFDEYEKEYARMPEWFPLEKLDSIRVASSVDWRPYVRDVEKHV